jgi:FHA domain
LLAEALANVFFINFTEMNAIKYYTIGSELQNDLPITGADCASFHLLLMRNASGQVLVSNRLPQNGYAINGQQYLHLMALQAGDELSIGGQKINWMTIFDISEEEISAREVKEEFVKQEQKGLRIQLVFIYLAIALVLFLLAFFI